MAGKQKRIEECRRAVLLGFEESQLPDDLHLDQLRHRLYAAYASSHAGLVAMGSQVPGFRRDILPHLPRDRQVSILDLGCGQGHYLRQLLALGFEHARGIDVSPEQVQIAQASGLTQVSLGDYRDSLGEAELDVVIGTDVLEHFTKFEVLQAMDRIRRALRPGGILILRVPNAGSPFSGTLRYGDLTHETSFTERSLHQLGAATGFSTVQVYACAPPVHGVMSAVRACIWWVVSAMITVALVGETGQMRGHVTTQNIVAVMRIGGGRGPQ
jgi:2-polyprenyl-3-methyl-5-hydroxy-6-metoxy-1,4-benzoquinol methylase